MLPQCIGEEAADGQSYQECSPVYLIVPSHAIEYRGQDVDSTDHDKSRQGYAQSRAEQDTAEEADHETEHQSYDSEEDPFSVGEKPIVVNLNALTAILRIHRHLRIERIRHRVGVLPVLV